MTAKVWRGTSGLRRSLVSIDSLESWSDGKKRGSNPRRGDIKAVAESLEGNGQKKPVVVWGNVIVAGHHLVLAATELGWTHIAVLDGDFADEEEARRFLVADNRTSELGYTDDELLEAQLARLRDLRGTAYTPDDLSDLQQRLATLRAGERIADPDLVPPVPPAAISQRGEVYELGPHRLMCGDATDPTHVALLAQGVRFAAVVTDPPYGIDHEGIANDDPRGLRSLFDRTLAAAPLEDAVVVAFQSPRLVVEWLDAIRHAGHTFERMLWLHRQSAKTYPWHGWVMASDAIAVSSVGHPAWPEPPDYCHDTYVKTELDPTAVTGTHTTIKPSWVFRDLMSKIPGGPVYEPFAGSGTAIIAAEMLARPCYAMELDPVYCDVIRRRYAEYADRPDLAP
jgi:hypothetical protein